MALQQVAIPQDAKFEYPNHFVLTGKRGGKAIGVDYDSGSITGNSILTYTYKWETSNLYWE